MKKTTVEDGGNHQIRNGIPHVGKSGGKDSSEVDKEATEHNDKKGK
jgi:hypothetical protein